MEPLNSLKLPESAIALLVQAAGDESASKLAVGDVVAELIDELIPGGLSDREYDLWVRAIRSAAASITGLAFDTIRDRERVARAVPLELRGEYPLFLYHHWRALLSSGARFHFYTRWLAAETELRGRVPPVDEIHGRIAAARESASIPLWLRRLGYLDRIAGKMLLSYDGDLDPRARAALENLVAVAGLLSREWGV